MRLMNYNIHSGKDSAGQMNLEAMAQAKQIADEAIKNAD